MITSHENREYFGRQNSRRFQFRSCFSDDVVENSWWQQVFKGSLLFRWRPTQMKSRRTTTMKEMKGSIGSYRILWAELHRQQHQTVSYDFQCGLFQPVLNRSSKQAAIMSFHAFTVNHFHNCQVSFSVIQGQRGSSKSSDQHWMSVGGNYSEQLQTYHRLTDSSCS